MSSIQSSPGGTYWSGAYYFNLPSGGGGGGLLGAGANSTEEFIGGYIAKHYFPITVKHFILGRTYFVTEAEIDMLGRYSIWDD